MKKIKQIINRLRFMLGAKPHIVKIKKNRSIRFAEWLAGEGWTPYDSNETWIQSGGRKVCTTPYLYKSWKQDRRYICKWRLWFKLHKLQEKGKQVFRTVFFIPEK